MLGSCLVWNHPRLVLTFHLFIYLCFMITSLFSFDLALFVSVLGCFSCFPENVKHEEFGDLQGIPSHCF